MMTEIGGIRAQLIETGNCVEQDAGLFAEVDNGNARLRIAAERSCSACPDRGLCVTRLGELSARFAEAGIQNTVIAGTRLELESAHASDDSRERLTRIYSDEGTTRHIEYKKLPNWFLSEFSQAQPGSLWVPIRKLARERNSRVGIGGLKWNGHARSLQPHIQDLCLPAANFTARDTKKMQDDVCRFYSRIELNLNTFLEPNIDRLRALASEYIGDCKAIKALGFGDALAVALSYSPEECANALKNPKYTQQLTQKAIMEAFEQNANADAMLDRVCRWFPEALSRYSKEKPALTEGTLKHLVLRAARQDNEARVAVFVEDFLARFAAVQRLCAGKPHIRDYDIRIVAMNYSSPEEAVVALEKRLGATETAKFDSWEPVLSVRDGWLGGFMELSVRSISFFNRISEEEVQKAIARIDLTDMPVFERALGNETETVYGKKMLIAISHELCGRTLKSFKERFLFNDEQMQKVRVFLLDAGYRIFEGDVFSPAAYRLLCKNLAVFYRD